MYDGLVKEMDKVMQELKKLLEKQKNDEEQVKWPAVPTVICCNVYLTI